MTLEKLKTAAAEAAGIAKEIVADSHQGQSQFAAGIRSVLDHANELIALHAAWVAANPPAAAAPAPTPTATAK